jgi:diguanylate cyclase (GGDEF)-like protein
LLLPAVSAVETALSVAERICHAVRETVMLPDRGAESPRVTISIGGAVHQPGENVETLIHRADQLLYRAKREGRDRAIC